MNRCYECGATENLTKLFSPDLTIAETNEDWFCPKHLPEVLEE